MDDLPTQPRPSDVHRKLRSKRFNEGLKLAATLLNSSSILAIGAALIGPIAQRHDDVLADGGWTLILSAVLLHLMSQFVIRFPRSEA